LRFQLNDATALKFSYTEMSQAIHLLRAHYVDLPMSSWLPSTNEIPPMRSRQIAGGVYANLPHNISLSIEGYWKNMMNLYEYCGINSIYPDLMNWEEELVMGKGRSYGAEIEMRWRSEKMDVAAYYTLSWTERYFEDIWPTWYPARNDTRHKFNINATRRFTGKFEMYASWNYTSGNRMTVPSQIIGSEIYYTSPYNHKLPDYHRLDIGFNFRKTTKRGNESIWNLSIYNAYCRLNPMFYMTNTITDIYGENKRIVLKQCAMIPILPSFSYTLRF
jgi:outer membrane receptor protein involved in Fe transport